jgi:hypothetical protein
MKLISADTYWARIYMSGPIEVAKHVIRQECMRQGLCVTIEPTTFIYTGGEEVGFVVGLVNYPRFPSASDDLYARARDLMGKLLDSTFQHSALLMMPHTTEWVTKRADAEVPAEPDDSPYCPHCGQLDGGTQ